MIKPEKLTALVDSREQRRLDLSPLRMEVATLDTGDYSARGLESVVRVERKSLPDLVACVGWQRQRFEREVARLLAYPVRVLVVEASWQQIEAHSQAMPQWRGKVTSSQVLGSVLGWEAAGLSIHMVGDHERAGTHVSRLLYTVAKRRWRELEALRAAVEGQATTPGEEGPK